MQADDLKPTTPDPQPRRIGIGLAEQRRRRKMLILVLLLALLATLLWLAYYYNQHKRLPFEFDTEGAAAVPAPEFLYSITGGTGPGSLRKPTGVAVSAQGRVYVTDAARRQVQVYTRQGRHLFSFKRMEEAEPELRSPVHLVIDPKGQLWVTDRRLKDIYVFDLDGRFVRRFEPEGKDESWSPLALTFDDAGNLYVTDVGNTDKHRVLVFAPDGRKLAMFGKTAEVTRMTESPGDFYFPNGIAVIDDLIYVSDGDNRRVQIFEKTGQFRRIMQTAGVPRGVVGDSRTTLPAAVKGPLLYVVDALAHQVDIWNTAGERLTQFGEGGVGPGQFAYPNDIALDTAGRIYVSDRDNAQVQVWAWPQPVVPPIPVPKKPSQWALCLSPLLLLLVPLARRKRSFLATPDFVEGMAATRRLAAMDHWRLRFHIAEEDHEPFVGRMEQGIDLGRLLIPEVHSPSDAAALVERLDIPPEQAARLAMAMRAKRLATEDQDLRRLAVLLDIDVYDGDEFTERFGGKTRV